MEEVRRRLQRSVAVFVQLRNVLSDITGESGLRIIEGILAGERSLTEYVTVIPNVST